MELSKDQQSIIDDLKELNSKKEINYLYVKHSVLEYIFKLDINASSKLLLVYLLKNVVMDLEHLYVIAPYEKVVKDLGLSKPTIVKCMKELNTKNIIKLHSGTNKEINTEIKAFIFKREQFKLFTPNQHNIVELTLFFKTFFQQSKEV